MLSVATENVPLQEVFHVPFRRFLSLKRPHFNLNCSGTSLIVHALANYSVGVSLTWCEALYSWSTYANAAAFDISSTWFCSSFTLRESFGMNFYLLAQTFLVCVKLLTLSFKNSFRSGFGTNCQLLVRPETF